MAYYRCGPTALGNRASWAPVTSPTVDPKAFDRPLSGNFDRIFNSFERSNVFEYVKTTEDKEVRHIGHSDIVVNRRLSSSFERADCSLAAQAPSAEDEDFYREKILYSQARQLFPLQEDLADWINKTIGITYLTGENFLDVLDNGVELCQLAAVIRDKAMEALQQGLIVGPVPQIRGRCWQRAARRSFFSRDNTENFITFCRDLGVHENLLFESDDLVLHNQPRQVILCLLEVARIATRYNIEPPGLVELEKEIAMEERDSGLDSAMSSAAWQFRDVTPEPEKTATEAPPSSPKIENELAIQDQADAESTKSEGTVDSTDSDIPLKPTNELDKRVQLVTRLMERGCSCGAGKCSKLLKVKKVGEGRYNIAGRNVFIRLLKGRHMMVRVGGGWDTLEHFLSRHEPCQVRLVTQGKKTLLPVPMPEEKSPERAPSPKASGKSSPLHEGGRRTPKPTPTPNDKKKPLSTPTTPRNLRTPTERKPSTIPKKSRSMSLALDKTPDPKKERSQSLASTPVEKKSFCGTDKLNSKKSRSMSLASPAPFKQINKSASVVLPMTQAAIEESIRVSLASTISDTAKKPFLHIKAKYRSPPPREIPPR